MEKRTIMLACAAGMSTSLLVSKMQKYAQENDKDYKIFAVASTEVLDKIEEEKIDCLLLGPQIRFMEEEFKNELKDKDIPVGVIAMQDYGMMNGQNVVTYAEELMGI